MKADNLMINDWVINRGAKVRVVALDAYNHEIETEVTHKGDNGVRVKEVEPIPLTDGFWAANGWEEDILNSVGKRIKSSQGTFIDIVYYTDVHLLSIIEWIGTKKVARFANVVRGVHQLQQAFRSCGIGYLADDLNVE